MNASATVNESIPDFEGSIEGYVKKMIKDWRWRVESYMTDEDLLQEAWLVYLQVRDRYRDTVDNPAWFMGLFKSSLRNRFHDLAQSATKSSKETTVYRDGDDPGKEVDILETVEDADSGSLLALKLDEAPEELRQVLSLVLNAPAEMLGKAETAWRQRGKKKYMRNTWLCQCLGYDASKRDLERELYDYLEVPR